MRITIVVTLALLATAAAAQPPMGGPPPEARSACAGKQEGASCTFTTPRGELSGTCRNVREGMACVPAGGGPRGPGGMGPGMGRGSNGPGMGPASGGFAGGPPRTDIAGTNPAARKVASRIPDTHQGSCFDDSHVIPCPQPGQPYYGQDAQYEGATPSYRVNGDGTVTDRVTGLMWQQGHNATRLGWYEARAACSALRLGGHNDWRLPSIRELYSIADFRGTQGHRPYLDDVFEIHEPDASILEGDRFASTHRTEMMGQTWSSTIYTGDHWDRKGVEAAFFMNFLDGHIKQAPTRGRQGLFYRCVRGPAWGENDFVDDGDGTVTDRMSGLMWQQRDDGQTRDWPAALAYCEALNLAGHGDWRLPNVKELQSIVDYRRHDPALDERFLKQTDHRGWFWSSTTHGDNIAQADYVCFGKCTSVDGVDVHGAGAQRSDPKRGDNAARRSQGGQQDEIRIHNYVRCVR
jgi:Protein of unknown function (DUF1566)